jgi:formylglycine-generating enzyme required for sulfatase activity
VTLPLANVAEAMVRLNGSNDFVMGASQFPELAPHHRSVPAFFFDRREVTFADYRQSPAQSLPEIVDASDPNASVNQILYDVAVAWAEMRGKLLPTETQYEFAATRGGTRAYPWGDDGTVITEWGLETAAAYDQTATDPPIRGLYSGVAEWTRTWMQFYPRYAEIGPAFGPREYRMVRGAPGSIIDGKPLASDGGRGARYRQPVPRVATQSTIGFRCARSVEPQWKPADFERVLRDGE